MYIPENSISKREGALFLFCLLAFFLIVSHSTASDTYSFETTKGLKIKVNHDKNIDFVHASLLIFYDPEYKAGGLGVIKYITMLNMFDNILNTPASGLLSTLRRLGNDFKIHMDPDFIKISVNFLPERISTFTHFLTEIFTYKAFYLKKFYESKQVYWERLFRRKEWAREIACQIAYDYLFQDYDQGCWVISEESFRRINLAQVLHFYSKNYRPDRSVLVIKTHLNPHLTFGLIEKNMNFSFKKVSKTLIKEKKLRSDKGQRIIVLNTHQNNPPRLFWFEVAPQVNHQNFLPYLIINHTLFGELSGRIYRSRSRLFRRQNYQIKTEMITLAERTLLYNHIDLDYGTIADFIIQVDQEKRKFKVRNVDRREYLDALNYYLGRERVESAKPDYQVKLETQKVMAQSEVSQYPSFPSILEKIPHARVMRVARSFYPSSRQQNVRDSSVIVIIGNAQRIVENLKEIKFYRVESFSQEIRFFIRRRPDSNR